MTSLKFDICGTTYTLEEINNMIERADYLGIPTRTVKVARLILLKYHNTVPYYWEPAGINKIMFNSKTYSNRILEKLLKRTYDMNSNFIFIKTIQLAYNEMCKKSGCDKETPDLVKFMDSVPEEDMQRACEAAQAVIDDMVKPSGKTPNPNVLVETPHGIMSESKIESTGGKSDYYKIHLPEKVAKRVAEQGYIEFEDLMKYGFGNDFDYSTALKSLKRMYEDQYGKGKAGSDLTYNKNKINYSLDKIINDIEENN